MDDINSNNDGTWDFRREPFTSEESSYKPSLKGSDTINRNWVEPLGTIPPAPPLPQDQKEVLIMAEMEEKIGDFVEEVAELEKTIESYKKEVVNLNNTIRNTEREKCDRGLEISRLKQEVVEWKFRFDSLMRLVERIR